MLLYGVDRSLTISRDAVELRLLDRVTARAVADLAATGIHPPGYMPFTVPWSEDGGDAAASRLMSWMTDVFDRSTFDSWTLLFGVWRDSELVGATNLVATNHRAVGVVSTGSWLAATYQGRGTARMMRSILVDFTFSRLRSRLAVSEAFHDNAASRGVNESAGYLEIGQRLVERRGEEVALIRYELPVDVWNRQEHSELRICGAGWTRGLVFSRKNGE